MDNPTGIVVCPHCGARNRLNESEPDRLPVCGKCKNPLPWVTEATDATFQNKIGSPGLVMVDFWAAWCAPCKLVTPILEQIAREKAGQLKLVKVDVDRNPATASQFMVQSIPMIVLFKGGKVVDTIVGAVPKPELSRRIAPYLE